MSKIIKHKKDIPSAEQVIYLQRLREMFNFHLSLFCLSIGTVGITVGLTDLVRQSADLVSLQIHFREAVYPIDVPVRWSLVRGSVNGYQANQWGLHPLFALSEPTT